MLFPHQRIRPETVGADGSTSEPTFGERPNCTYYWNKKKPVPPAGFSSVVPTLHFHANSNPHDSDNSYHADNLTQLAYIFKLCKAILVQNSAKYARHQKDNGE